MYGFLLVFNSVVIWPYLAPLRDKSLQNLSDLKFDLSRILKVKSNGTDGLPIYEFRLCVTILVNLCCHLLDDAVPNGEIINLYFIFISAPFYCYTHFLLCQGIPFEPITVCIIIPKQGCRPPSVDYVYRVQGHTDVTPFGPVIVTHPHYVTSVLYV